MFRLLGATLSLLFLGYVVLLTTGGAVDVARHGVTVRVPPVLVCSAVRC